jgi:phenylacetate-CoA ligase
MKIALVGLGAVGAPIAHRLFKKYGNDFVILSDYDHEQRLSEIREINGDPFNARIVTSAEQLEEKIDILIVCVKNYDLIASITSAESFISADTIIIPLQNGIWACRYLRNKYKYNVIAECYVRGPDTRRIYNGFEYNKSGVIHIGTSIPKEKNKLQFAYKVLKDSGLDIIFEEEIKKMVWRKWMLNVAGNTVTALTGASYRMFADSKDLQMICRQIMREFLLVANSEGVALTWVDIDEIIDYYCSFSTDKITSMLEDVKNEKHTENEYITGELLRMAEERGINIPINKTMYTLVKLKEYVYTSNREEKNKMNNEKITTKASVLNAMNDIQNKLSQNGLSVDRIRDYSVVELQSILKYSIEHSEYYKKISERRNLIRLTDFPVMNKTLLNENYDSIFVSEYKNVNTHSMHTSGSTGIPFTVVQNLEKRDRHIADLKYFGEIAGYMDHDPLCYLRAKPTATPEEQREQNIWQLDICNLNEENLMKYYQIMVDKKCTALMAYPSTLDTAVTLWSKNVQNTSCVRTIISTSETLTNEVRNKLRLFFGEEVNIVARYSNTENGVLGQEISEDHYIINWASYFIEILKFDSDEPANIGELGRIVVTDLYNLAFPMIRYDTGDVARMVYPETGLPYLESLFGRRMDLIYDTNGDVVSPFLLCRTMRLSHGIEQWQFIQESRDTYTLKITSNTHDKPNVDKEVQGFKKTLGEGAIINVEYVENIPVMNSLKRKLIVSNLKK